MTKSELFRQYNKARAAARKGAVNKAGQSVTENRVNSALSLLQSKAERPYTTTLTGCNCPDQITRPSVICKHRLALMIKTRAAQSAETEPAAQTPAEPEPYRKTPLSAGSRGDFVTAEQGSGHYSLHWFESEDDFYAFSAAHPQVIFVNWTEARGRRLRPDTCHPLGG